MLFSAGKLRSIFKNTTKVSSHLMSKSNVLHIKITVFFWKIFSASNASVLTMLCFRSKINDNGAKPNQQMYSCCKCKTKFDQLADLTRHIVNRCFDKTPSPMLARQLMDGSGTVAEKSLKRKLFQAESCKAHSKQKNTSPANVSPASNVQTLPCAYPHKSFSSAPPRTTKTMRNICKYCHCKFKSSYSLKTHFLTYGKSCKTGSRHKVDKEAKYDLTDKEPTGDRTHLVKDGLKALIDLVQDTSVESKTTCATPFPDRASETPCDTFEVPSSTFNDASVTKRNQSEFKSKNACEIFETMQVPSTTNVPDPASKASSLTDTSKLKTCTYCQQSFCFYYKLKKHMATDCQKLSALRKQCKRTLFQKNICRYCSLKFTSTTAARNHTWIYCTKFVKNKQSRCNSLKKKSFTKRADRNQNKNSYQHKNRAAATSRESHVVENTHPTKKLPQVLGNAKVTFAKTLSNSSKTQKSSAQSSSETCVQEKPRTAKMEVTRLSGNVLKHYTASQVDETTNNSHKADANILQPAFKILKPNNEASNSQQPASNSLKLNAAKSQNSHSEKTSETVIETTLNLSASNSLKSIMKKLHDRDSEETSKIPNEGAMIQQPSSDSLLPNTKKFQNSNSEKILSESSQIPKSCCNTLNSNDEKSQGSDSENALKFLKETVRIHQSSSNSLKSIDRTPQNSHSETTAKIFPKSTRIQQPSSGSLLNEEQFENRDLGKILNESSQIQKPCSNSLNPNSEKMLKVIIESFKIQQPSNSSKPIDKKSQENNSDSPKILNESATIQQPSNNLKPNVRSQNSNSEKTLKVVIESSKIQQPSISLKPVGKKSQDDSGKSAKIFNESSKIQQPSNSLRTANKKFQESHSEKSPKILNESATIQQPNDEKTPKIPGKGANIQQGNNSDKTHDKISESTKIQQSSNSLKSNDKKLNVPSPILATLLSQHSPNTRSRTPKAALKCKFVCTFCNIGHIKQSDLSTHQMLYCKMANEAKKMALTSKLNSDIQTSSSKKTERESTNQPPKTSALNEENSSRELDCNSAKTPVIKPTECAMVQKSPSESLNDKKVPVGTKIAPQVSADRSEATQINAEVQVATSIEVEENSPDRRPNTVECGVTIKIEPTDENVIALQTDQAKPKDAFTGKTLDVSSSQLQDLRSTDPIPREVEEITAADIGNLIDDIKLESDSVLPEELLIQTVTSEPEDMKGTQIVENDSNTSLNKTAIEGKENVTEVLKRLKPTKEPNIPFLKATVCNTCGYMFERTFSSNEGETRSQICKCMHSLKPDHADLDQKVASPLDVLELQTNITLDFEDDQEDIQPAIICDQCRFTCHSNIDLKSHKCTFVFSRTLGTVSEVPKSKLNKEKNLFENASTTECSEITKSPHSKVVFDLRDTLNKKTSCKVLKSPSGLEANVKRAESNETLIEPEIDHLKRTEAKPETGPCLIASTARNKYPRNADASTNSSASQLHRRSNKVTSRRPVRSSQMSIRNQASDNNGKRNPSIYCEECGTTIRNVDEIDYPRCGHAITAFRCPVCGDRYPNIPTLIAHVYSVHSDSSKVVEKEMLTRPSRGSAKYYCCSCGLRFCFIKNLIDHMISYHNFFHRQSSNTSDAPIIHPSDPTIKGFACTYCDNPVFSTLERLFYHEDTSKSHKKYQRLFENVGRNYNPVEERKFDYICFVCDLGFISFKSLKIHMLVSARHHELDMEVRRKVPATQKRQEAYKSLACSKRHLSEPEATSLQTEGKVQSDIKTSVEPDQCSPHSYESNLNEDDEQIPVIDLGQNVENVDASELPQQNPSQLATRSCALNTFDLLKILQDPSDTEIESCNVKASDESDNSPLLKDCDSKEMNFTQNDDVDVLMEEMYSTDYGKEYACFGCRKVFMSRKLFEQHACSGPF